MHFSNLFLSLQVEREKADLSVQVIQLTERIEEVEAGADGQVRMANDNDATSPSIFFSDLNYSPFFFTFAFHICVPSDTGLPHLFHLMNYIRFFFFILPFHIFPQ